MRDLERKQRGKGGARKGCITHGALRVIGMQQSPPPPPPPPREPPFTPPPLPPPPPPPPRRSSFSPRRHLIKDCVAALGAQRGNQQERQE
ncbi:unnamed protein product [Closterium sp. NIES-53]